MINASFCFDRLGLTQQHTVPVMDGLEACRQIREAGSSVEIVALTANADTNARDECIAAGMSGFLTKPVNFGLVQKLVYDIIKKRASE